MRTLLVIDDEPDVRDMIRDHFGLRGYAVHTAPDGQAGIAAAQTVKPDVILLDLKMKVMDGDKAIPHLLQISPRPKIFVISAYQDDATREHVMALGIDGYYEKPVSILELQKAVEAVLKESGHES